MSFTTFEFFLFIAAAVIIYYVIPKKLQWIWLLIISYVYYASYDISTVWMLLLTTYVTYRGGILLDRLNEQKPQDGISREEKKDFKKNIVRKRKNSTGYGTYSVWNAWDYEVYQFYAWKYRCSFKTFWEWKADRSS